MLSEELRKKADDKNYEIHYKEIINLLTIAADEGKYYITYKHVIPSSLIKRLEEENFTVRRDLLHPKVTYIYFECIDEIKKQNKSNCIIL
jgi:hypothetical protein